MNTPHLLFCVQFRNTTEKCCLHFPNFIFMIKNKKNNFFCITLFLNCCCCCRGYLLNYLLILFINFILILFIFYLFFSFVYLYYPYDNTFQIYMCFSVIGVHITASDIRPSFCKLSSFQVLFIRALLPYRHCD